MLILFNSLQERQINPTHASWQGMPSILDNPDLLTVFLLAIFFKRIKHKNQRRNIFILFYPNTKSTHIILPSLQILAQSKTSKETRKPRIKTTILKG
jgi:hypothetical protein